MWAWGGGVEGVWLGRDAGDMGELGGVWGSTGMLWPNSYCAWEWGGEHWSSGVGPAAVQGSVITAKDPWGLSCRGCAGTGEANFCTEALGPCGVSCYCDKGLDWACV